MESAGGVATSTSVTRVHAFVSSPFSSTSSLFLREHLHWPCSHFAAQSLKSGSIFDGSRKNKPFKRSYSMEDRSSQEDERRSTRGSSSGKWSSQKRLLTLFKQIETSISQEKSRSTNERESTKSSKDYHVSFDSVLEALEESDEGERHDYSVKFIPSIGQTVNKGSESVSNQKKRATKEKNEPSLVNPEPSAVKAMRPPSSFVKKSPISSSSSQRIKSIDVADGVDEVEPLRLEKMKLTELKEAAKARGIKGYSKLKKSELVDLLSTQGL